MIEASPALHRILSAGLLLTLAMLVTAGCGGGGGAPAAAVMPPRPNVIIILVDTLRADAVGFGGAERDTSPRLDAWARKGVVFNRATTPAGWTKPAVVSLLTGLYPAAHGVQDKDHVLPDQVMTLAEVFRSAGYRTQAFVTNFAVSAQFGTGQGFDAFRFFDKKVDSPPDVPKKLNYVPVGVISPEIEAFFQQAGDRPFFAYIHTTDPHYPYLPPEEHLLFGTDPRARYDGEVHYTDAVIGEWMDLLRRTGLLERSIVVLTADHGEEFREHGYTGHGVTVFEECARVPLVIWAPGLPAGHRDELVSLADVPVSLLEGASIPRPPAFGAEGRSFWGAIASGGRVQGWSWAYSELVYPTKAVTFAYREGGYKVLHIVHDLTGRKDVTYLFNLIGDPSEQRDIKDREPKLFRTLQQKMRAVRKQHLADAVGQQREALDEEAVRQLRALGYID